MAESDVPWLWWVLAMLRMLWVVVPQTGYIHPDEFFQSTEVIAGDVLDLEVERPWEYDPVNPIRSPVLPSVVCWPGFYVLRLLRDSGVFPGPLAPPTYYMLVVPRLTVAVLSLISDVLVYKIAKNLHLGPKETILYHATSYVSFVYLTRTFSNTFESFLFTGLLYACTRHSGKTKNNSGSTAIAVILVAGVFNRPTFVAFAAVPCCYWLLFTNTKFTISDALGKIIQCGIKGIISTIFLIICDSMYFRNLTIERLIDLLQNYENLEQIKNDIVITPLNFLLYNTNPSNLAEHGLHPRVTHVFVNMPMLFGPCVVIYFIEAIKILIRLPLTAFRSVKKDPSSPGTEKKIVTFLMLVITMPLLILSAFPHQEARFLLPLLSPMSLLCGGKIFRTRRCWRLPVILWIIFNAVAACVFGVYHQGGVTSSITFLQKHLNNKFSESPQSIHVHVFFLHTYMPPRHLLAIPKQPIRDHNTNYLHIHDLKGSPIGDVVVEIENLYHKNPHKKLEFIIVTPALVTEDLCKHFRHKLSINSLYAVHTHVSFDEPFNLFHVTKHYGACQIQPQSFEQNILNAKTLDVLSVEYKTVSL